MRTRRSGCRRSERVRENTPCYWVCLETIRLSFAKPIPRTIATLCSWGFVGSRFEGESAFDEVTENIANSGVEPQAHCAAVYNNIGALLKSAGTMGLTNHFFSRWLLMCVVRVDGRHSAVAEHISRRTLQQQAAFRRDPRQPNFDSIDPYMLHATDATGAIRAAKFERFVAERNHKTDYILKQHRLVREDASARTKRTNTETRKERQRITTMATPLPPSDTCSLCHCLDEILLKRNTFTPKFCRRKRLPTRHCL